ncbi:MAG: hypothetical protein RQ751_01010 [Longimicrobiales bacterium]|nr:hypothetical protein [Longimicrobiales bacterium]
MRFWEDIKQRRITQIVLSYLVGGWIILQAVDQVVDREVLPRYVYVVALIFFLFGLPAALIIGWFHGEKGTQKAPALEIALLALLALGATGMTTVTVRNALLLERAQAGRVELSRIAVLYFTGADDQTGLVGERLTEELIARLTRVPELDVISRNGARTAREQTMTLEEAAAFFDAGTIVEGDVRRSGDQYVVAAQIRTGDGIRLGNVSARGPADDLVALEERVISEIEAEFRAVLGNEIRFRAARSEAPNNGAWLAVAQGERAVQEGVEAAAAGNAGRARAALESAEASLREAARLGEDWDRPWILLSRAAYEGAWLEESAAGMAERLRESVTHADAALERDRSSAEAFSRRGTARYLRYLARLDDNEDAREATLKAAQADLERAVELDRTLADPYSTLSHLYYQVQDPASAALAARQAYENDAYLQAADGVLRRLFTTNYDLQRADQAAQWCAEGRRRFPENFLFTECALWLMTMPTVDPAVETGWALVDSVAALAPHGREAFVAAGALQVMGGVLARAGLADSASTVMTRARVGSEVDPEGELLSMEAAMRLLNGEREEAIDLLQRYTAANPGHFARGRGLHWWWRSLEGDEAFERMRRLN